MIVHADGDVEYAAERIAWGGFTNSGQPCISVQRVYVHDSIYDCFTKLLVEKVEALNVGDPLDEDVDVGPVIDAPTPTVSKSGSARRRRRGRR